MHNISKYIDWASIWAAEVKPTLMDKELYSGEVWEIISVFNHEKGMELDFSECEIQDDAIMFQFSESGGKNESDTQGWFMSYWFKCRPSDDFIVFDAGYEQG